MKTVAGLDLCFAVVPFLSRGHVIENSHLNFEDYSYLWVIAMIKASN